MKSITSTRTGGLISLLGLLTPNAPIDAAFVPSVLFGGKIGTSTTLRLAHSYYFFALLEPIRDYDADICDSQGLYGI